MAFAASLVFGDEEVAIGPFRVTFTDPDVMPKYEAVIRPFIQAL